MKRIYLACPYSHWNPLIQLWRWLWVSRASYKLMQRKYCVFSPVSHSVPISWFQSKKDNCHDFWLAQDERWLMRCHEIYVLAMRGWDKSHGIDWEIKRGKYWGKPVKLIHPKTLRVLEVLNG